MVSMSGRVKDQIDQRNDRVYIVGRQGCSAVREELEDAFK